ncbi:MAG: 2-C-methyl-D-erythritol 2,4-cyclodiphosphate synthase [Pseudomonadota bacterium]|jgi:2-C-methyl-D-erythritol 2,4-cyclodiphosphate synthase|nr:2-C-methyl-D-erythritol 2,4-cyclodiphosphate synthase [Pseudomonadota bacterium]HCY39489.1 2-C-methyl-D-erythritol 2,4-cyclodiphosphate synthase [Neisseriales bacterium]
MFRIGQGFDLHRLVAGRKLILGGIEIPYEYGLAGHSDADVLIHAIIDALIGAVALGDIGKLFPDNDSKFKDIDSKILLKKVYQQISELGYQINNIDSTIILEQPKLRDYIDLMRASLAKVLDLRIDQISIKAKTSEKIGVVGRGEAAIAEAVVLLIK